MIRQTIHHHTNIRYPRKVRRFDDKLLLIRTLAEKSVLIRLPYKEMVKIMNYFWSNYNAFSEFLITYVPLLSSYTLK
jgi:hypothetical protein